MPGDDTRETEIREVPRLTCEELKHSIDAGEKIVIVDTRTSADYSSSHILGAINIPYSPTGDSMEREIMLSALPQDRLLVLYCD
jgi:rhodanese-related sulfurtransferase